MEKIAEQFTKVQDGKKITYTQIEQVILSEGRRICVYGLSKPDQEQHYAFEVFIPRLQLEDKPMPTSGYISKAGEKYPGNNDFGSRALYIGGVGTYQDKINRVQDAIIELKESFEQAEKKQQSKKINKLNRDANNAN